MPKVKAKKVTKPKKERQPVVSVPTPQVAETAADRRNYLRRMAGWPVKET